MARSPRTTVGDLLDKYGPLVKASFLDAIADLRDNIVLKVIVERLEKGDIQGAIEALHLDADAFAKLERAVSDAYNAGGDAAVGDLPKVTEPNGNRVVFRFGVRNLAGETDLRQHSAQMVTNIVEDQKIGIRAALTGGLHAGQNPRATALDVIGRVNRVTGRREGGIIGLTSAQEAYVASARAELASGDPAQLKSYLGRGRRDKRFDKVVARAAAQGKPLDAETVAKIAGRYSDRLLDLRGEALARTETMTALGKARDDAIRQQIAAGKVDAQDVTKIWRTAGDNRVRETHRALNGQSVAMEGVFHSPSGAALRFPGDPNAPASEIINCRCFMEYKVDFMAKVVRNFRRAA